MSAKIKVPEFENQRRKAARFVLSVPVWLGSCAGEPNALARDMSADGIFFYTHSMLAVGAEIEFRTKLPLEAVVLPEIQVRYTGKVVRVEKLTAGFFGVAARMESHEFLV